MTAAEKILLTERESRTGSEKRRGPRVRAMPLAILAIPFLDTGFVIAKRLKYKRKPWSADDNHFHHRMARIGFSVRRTVLFFYGWTLMLAGYAVALRFIHYSYYVGHTRHVRVGSTILVVGLGLIVAAASVYLVYVLEILKFNRRNRR